MYMISEKAQEQNVDHGVSSRLSSTRTQKPAVDVMGGCRTAAMPSNRNDGNGAHLIA